MRIRPTRRLEHPRRSETRDRVLPTLKTATGHGLVTFIGFVVAGIVPLLAYLLPTFQDMQFAAATILALAGLFTVGAGRAFFTGRGWFISGLEMLLIGALAGAVAYVVGALGALLVRETLP